MNTFSIEFLHIISNFSNIQSLSNICDLKLSLLAIKMSDEYGLPKIYFERVLMHNQT